MTPTASSSSLVRFSGKPAEAGGGTGPATGDGLLLEEGTAFLLLENGSFLLLEG